MVAEPVTQPNDLPLLIQEIKETHRLRQDMVRAETALTLRIGAQRCRIICGGLQKGDTHACGRKGRYGVRPGQGHVADDAQDRFALPDPDGDDQPSHDVQSIGVIPFPPEGAGLGDSAIQGQDARALTADLNAIPLLEGRAVIHKARTVYERRVEGLAQQLPVWPWVARVRGFGALGLAQIVGECGDLDQYANPGKVWKRMGLALVFGERQRRVTGEEGIWHGYSPTRRAIMWNIGDSLIKGNRDGAYRTYYLAEKERQQELHPEVWVRGVDGKQKNAWKARAHNRAQRHMEKRLLRDLWRVWRDA